MGSATGGLVGAGGTHSQVALVDAKRAGDPDGVPAANQLGVLR